MNKYNIPTTAQQAFKILDTMIAPKDITAFRTMTSGEFSTNQHWGLDLWIRNNWIYRSGEESEEEQILLDKCYRMLAGKLVKKFCVQPDDISGYFLERYHRHLTRRQF